MINSLVPYEVDLAIREQEQLRREAALWSLARQAMPTDRRSARRQRLWLGLAVLGAALLPVSASLVARS
jgi:hypothetical protein